MAATSLVQITGLHRRTAEFDCATVLYDDFLCDNGYYTKSFALQALLALATDTDPLARRLVTVELTDPTWLGLEVDKYIHDFSALGSRNLISKEYEARALQQTLETGDYTNEMYLAHAPIYSYRVKVADSRWVKHVSVGQTALFAGCDVEPEAIAVGTVKDRTKVAEDLCAELEKNELAWFENMSQSFFTTLGNLLEEAPTDAYDWLMSQVELIDTKLDEHEFNDVLAMWGFL